MILRREQRPYWSPNTESHEEMIKELGLRDNTRDPDFVRVEIVPPAGDMRAPLDQWQYRVDQDLCPDWYDAADAEAQVRAALPDWVKMKVLVDGVHEVKSGNRYAYGSSRVVARDSSRVEAWGSSRVEARDSSRVVAWGSSRVVARDSSRVVARDSSSVEAWGSSRVVARDSSRVEAWGSSRVEAGSESTVNQWGLSCTVTLADRAVNIRRDSDKMPIPVERAKAAKKGKPKK
jgi:hypothetical protein